mgnify:CR=1 FL=1
MQLQSDKLEIRPYRTSDELWAMYEEEKSKRIALEQKLSETNEFLIEVAKKLLDSNGVILDTAANIVEYRYKKLRT